MARSREVPNPGKIELVAITQIVNGFNDLHRFSNKLREFDPAGMSRNTRLKIANAALIEFDELTKGLPAAINTFILGEES